MANTRQACGNEDNKFGRETKKQKRKKKVKTNKCNKEKEDGVHIYHARVCLFSSVTKAHVCERKSLCLHCRGCF